jgi:glycine/D-amino acid oxidase-like deaminating enzyme
VLGTTPVRGWCWRPATSATASCWPPITAEAIAELVATGRSAIDLAPFSLSRFK